MVVDTSALLALLQNEPDAELFEVALAAAEAPVISAATLLECSLVIERRFGEAGLERLDAMVREAGIQIIAFDGEQQQLARAAFRRFGRGRHAAQLNFGDCFAYALAKHRGEPLLYKGRDFAQTDIGSAI